MASTSGRQSLSLIKKLQKKPGRYEIFQMVRLIENICKTNGQYNWLRGRVNQQASPTLECINFEGLVHLEFPINEATSVKIIETTLSNRKFHQWVIETPVMGLNGMLGIMPQHYSDQIIRRLRLKDRALSRYFNYFNHRAMSLYYKAWAKYRIPLSFEKHRLKRLDNSKNPSEILKLRRLTKDDVSTAILSLAGLGTPSNQNRLEISDDALVGFSGYLSRTNALPAVNIEKMLKTYFNIPVNIQQFVAQSYPLFEDMQSCLEGRFKPGQNHCLGINTLLGQKTMLVQSKFNVVLGPLSYEEYLELSPGSKKLKALIEMLTMAAGSELDFDIEAQIRSNDLPPPYLGLEEKPVCIGWNATLSKQQAEGELIQVRLAK